MYIYNYRCTYKCYIIHMYNHNHRTEKLQNSAAGLGPQLAPAVRLDVRVYHAMIREETQRREQLPQHRLSHAVAVKRRNGGEAFIKKNGEGKTWKLCESTIIC